MPAMALPHLRFPEPAQTGADTQPIDAFLEDAETRDDLDAVMSWDGRVDQKATTAELSCPTWGQAARPAPRQTTSRIVRTQRRPSLARHRRSVRRIRRTAALREPLLFLVIGSGLLGMVAWLLRS